VTVGVLFGWWLGSSIGSDSSATPLVGLPVALSAAAGAVLVWLPRATVRAGQLPATRFLAFLAGGMMSVLTYTLLGAATPATERHPALQAGVCVLLPLLIVAAPGLRRYAIPVSAGVICAATALVVVAPTPATLGGPLVLAFAPALGALVVTMIAAAIGRARRRLRSPWAAAEDDYPPMPAEESPAYELVPARGAVAPRRRRAAPPEPTGQPASSTPPDEPRLGRHARVNP
jgi:hypothetical protein